MKLIAILALSLVSITGPAQTSFFFQIPNNDVFVRDAEGAPLFGTEYVAVLYGGPTPESLALATKFGFPSDSMQPVTFDLIPGIFHDGIVVVDSGFCGTPAWLQVRAWDTRIAPTFEAAEDLGLGGYGESDVFYATGGNVCNINPVQPGALSGLESFSLRPVVPEPSTWALLGMGGVAFLWNARRRKRALSRMDQSDCWPPANNVGE